MGHAIVEDSKNKTEKAFSGPNRERTALFVIYECVNLFENLHLL